MAERRGVIKAGSRGNWYLVSKPRHMTTQQHHYQGLGEGGGGPTTRLHPTPVQCYPSSSGTVLLLTILARSHVFSLNIIPHYELLGPRPERASDGVSPVGSSKRLARASLDGAMLLSVQFPPVALVPYTKVNQAEM